MADLNKTASAKSPIQLTGSDIHTTELFKAALTRGLDKVFKREFEAHKQGLQFLREENMPGGRETATFQSYRQLGGLIPQNRDADEIPFITSGDGFSYSARTYNFRQAIAIEKTLQEVDDVGVTRGRQGDLARKGVLTIEHSIADLFNRAVSPTSAPVLCDDGMYLIDTDRPNADPEAGTWSNQEANSAITPDAIFAAQLNARASTGEDGELYPQSIKFIICRPQDSKKLWEIRNSQYRPTDAMNVTNYFKEFSGAHFDIIVYDYLTSASLIYGLNSPKSDMNETFMFWRVRPEFKTYDGADNPDVVNQRIRMAFGLAAGSPRKMWRGGVVTG